MAHPQPPPPPPLQGGVLVLISPYSWLEEYTPKASAAPCRVTRCLGSGALWLQRNVLAAVEGSRIAN